MTRKAVRHALADWLNAAEIKGLDRVHPGPLYEVPWEQHQSDPTHMCQGWILVPRYRRDRIAGGNPLANGAPTGQKNVVATVRLVLFFRSTDPSGWLDAQDQFDDVTADVTSQLEAGARVAGRPDLFVSVGEYIGIDQQNDEPVALNGGTMQAEATITFEVDEVINA